MLATTKGLSQRDRRVLAVLVWTLLANWSVSLLKILIGTATATVTVIADGLHSLLDGTNNVIGIVAVRLAARPPDEEHPYGHRKFENIAAMFIGGLIVLISWELVDNVSRTIYRHLSGEGSQAAAPQSLWFAVLLAGSAGINLLVATYERRKGRQLNSSLLTADSSHTAADAMVTGLAIVALLTRPLAWWIDPLLTIGVLVFLVRAAWSIIRQNLPAFTDRNLLDPEEVRRVAENVPGVEQPHSIRSHGTEIDAHLDLHIVVSESLTAGEVTEIERALGKALQAEFPNVSLVSIHHQVHLPDPNAPLWKC